MRKGSEQHRGDMVRSQIFHQVFSVSLSIFGSVTNLVCILLVIYGGLFRQSRFAFFLNFLVCNLLMCSVALPFWTMFAFSPSAATDSSTLCRVQGYAILSISGTVSLNIALLSVNHYVCIVKYTWYNRVFTTRNIRILLFMAWFICLTLFLFPVLDIWGRFTYDKLRFLCTPLLTYGSYRYFIGCVFSLLSIPTILFCYVEILRKFKASKVSSLQNENIQRRKKENHLIRAIVCFITVDCALFFPVLVVTTIDPDMKTIPAWIHVLALYLKMSSYTVNSLVYSVLNKKIKSSFLNIVRSFFPNKKNSSDLNETATQQTPYSN